MRALIGIICSRYMYVCVRADLTLLLPICRDDFDFRRGDNCQISFDRKMRRDIETLDIATIR